MSINSIQDDCLFENQPHALTADEPRPWEKTERAALYSFSVAVGSLVSATVLKRKRAVYSPTYGIVLPPAPVEIAEAPLPEPERLTQPQMQQAPAPAILQQIEVPQAPAAEIPQLLEVPQAPAAQTPSRTPTPASPHGPEEAAAAPSTASPSTPKSSATPSAVSLLSPEASAAASAASPPAPPIKEKAPRCSEEGDQAHIVEIFTTVANTAELKLLFKKGHLDGLGDILRKHKVHPFEILRCIPKESMQKIFRDRLAPTITKTIKGIQEGMEREISNLERYAPGLAEDMGKLEERVIPLIRARNWRGLVCYLFDINDKHAR